MTNAHIVAAVIGIALSVTIVFLVRRDHISPRVAARWFLISIAVLVTSLVPSLVDQLGNTLGIGYPPIIPVLLAIGAALVKILLMDIERQKMQTKIDRLVQKIAIVEEEVEQLRAKTKGTLHIINNPKEQRKAD